MFFRDATSLEEPLLSSLPQFLFIESVFVCVIRWINTTGFSVYLKKTKKTKKQEILQYKKLEQSAAGYSVTK